MQSVRYGVWQIMLSKCNNNDSRKEQRTRPEGESSPQQQAQTLPDQSVTEESQTMGNIPFRPPLTHE
ncbi:hypothetical protein Q8A67_004856 [Cirrhinus molitorella]|uniref:Uncharacterized protein n=1 Tax=Cirrhinus molitorella TaxID=172907 RepID=A0AA88U3L8_9TELE|nr:hypothetical protein Q8A67_004856 [Cirrhinus molitorella]